MAIDAGTLVVKLTTETEQFKKGLDDAKKKVQSFGSGVTDFVAQHKAALAAGLAAVAAFAIKSIEAYGESEQASVKLTQALKNQGITSQKVRDDILAFSTAMQSLTTYTDEAVTAAQTTLTTYGLQGELLKRVTAATLDYASATGTDLGTAAVNVGKAFTGNISTIERYTGNISDSKNATEKFDAALKALEKRFGGQAAAQRATTLGQFTAMKNSFGELQEAIGGMLAGGGNSIVVWITTLIDKLTASILAIKTFAAEVGGVGNLVLKNFVLVIGAVIQAFFELINAIPGASFIMKQFGVSVEDVNALVEEQALKFQGMAEKAMTSAGVVFQAETTKQAAVTQTKLYQGDAEVQMTTATKSHVDARMALAMQEAQARTKLSDSMFEALKQHAGTWMEFATKSTTMVVDKLGSGVAQMILEGKKFSQVMKSLWIDMAAEFIKQVARMIAKWIAFQALKAATTGGFGGFFAEGGMIREPSLITGLHSGVQHIAGEAGPEAVVPQKKSASNRNGHFAEGEGGGGSVTVNVTIPISGQFIEGSPAKWQEMIRSTVVPEFRRWAMSHPNELVNRKRGSS